MATKKAGGKKDDKGGGAARIADNRRAKFDYHVEKKLEAGIVLQGSEVKSCREGKVQLVDSYATIERGELFLMKAHIAEYKQGGPFFNHEPTRKRKLLMHTREIRQLKASLEQEGYTLVPLKIYFSSKGIAKVELGLAKGKTKGDKRQSSKDQAQKRDVDKAMRRDRKS
jgi:SsrA-binding protein